ncbi:MAG: OmpH family outer membrane protein [Candidatus Cloacimonetes bacterium]|nr:OmpH family outer membrane protein [Candidatus Cloacimonadota bacterium]
MKRIIITTLLSLLLSTTLLVAQTIKIAYIDTDRIMYESLDTQEAQSIFMAERESWERELTRIEDEIERLQSDYEARKLTLTESGKAQAEERIQEKIRERRQYIESIFGEGGLAMQRNAELLEPIMDKLRDSIEKFALEENYSIIFDAVGGGILYAKPNLDITDLIIQDLNRSAGTGN